MSPKKAFPGERRVALVPSVIPESREGRHGSAHRDRAQESKPAIRTPPTPKRARRSLPDRAAVFAHADIIVQVLCYGSNDTTGKADIPLMRRDQVLIGFLRPLGSREIVQEIAGTGVTSFSVELMPRTTRAQSMDALSSMATVCGYKAVLIAADVLPRFFPMLTTAAGTITPARVLIIGVGVAGLQAIATARRLGAVVSAYDLRPAVKEQVQSLGGAFRRTADRGQGCAGRSRIRHRAGRSFLRPPARTARPRGRAKATWSSPPPSCPGRNRPCWSRPKWCTAWRPAR